MNLGLIQRITPRAVWHVGMWVGPFRFDALCGRLGVRWYYPQDADPFCVDDETNDPVNWLDMDLGSNLDAPVCVACRRTADTLARRVAALG